MYDNGMHALKFEASYHESLWKGTSTFTLARSHACTHQSREREPKCGDVRLCRWLCQCRVNGRRFQNNVPLLRQSDECRGGVCRHCALEGNHGRLHTVKTRPHTHVMMSTLKAEKTLADTGHRKACSINKDHTHVTTFVAMKTETHLRS